MSRIVLRGGRVIDPSTGRDEIADVIISELSQEIREETAGAGCFAYRVFRCIRRDGDLASRTFR